MPYLRCVEGEEARYILEEVQYKFVETIQGRGPWFAKLSE